MKKLLFTISLLTMAGALFAQKSIVLAAFDKYQINQNILDPMIKQTPTDLSYDYKFTSISQNKEKITVAKYDPTRAEGQRWVIVSIEGKNPSESDTKKFNKEHSKPAPNGTKIDDASMRVEKETADQLVINYKLDASTIPSEGSFLKDCRNYFTIDLKTKKLQQLQTLNEKPVKIRILNATKLDLIIKYVYNEEMNRYLPQSEDLNLIVKFLGQQAPMETVAEYSNFTKTK